MAEKHDGELSLISTGTIVEGKIKTEGSIRIDGRLQGDLMAKGNTAIGPGGVVEGTVSGRNITVAGKITGNVTAGEKLVLESKSTVKGDIRAQRLVVDEGSQFDGHCTMSAPSTGRTGGARE